MRTKTDATPEDKERYKYRLDNCRRWMDLKGYTSVFKIYCNFYEYEQDVVETIEPRFRMFWRKDTKIFDFPLLGKYEDMIETLKHE